MQKFICPFGAAFLQARVSKALSQWTVATRLNYHLRNIQRIEKGEQQPGIMLALRLVAAVDADVGDFFERLHRETMGVEQRATIDAGGGFEMCLPDRLPEVKCLFGPLFQTARLYGQVSQTAIAKRAGYSLRNINAVEKGQQEPGVMVALAMVGATGVDVRSFFAGLHAVLKFGKPV